MMAQVPEQVASKIKQINSDFKKQGGRISDHALLKITQKRTDLVGKIQKRYGQRPKTTPTTD